MQFILEESMFQNGSYSIEYGSKKATFTIIAEDYLGSGGLSLSVNRMICVIEEYDDAGSLLSEQFGSLVIGLGDKNVAVMTDDISIRGKLLSKDNMDRCLVELYED